MKEVFTMWRHTQMVVLVALSAAIYAAVLIPLKGFPIIPGAIEIRPANVFSMALESKGFGARPGRTFYLQTAMSGSDALVLVAFVALLAGCIALRVAGYGGLEGFSR